MPSESTVARRDLMAALTPDTTTGMFTVCILSVVVCLAERCLSFAHDRPRTPFPHDSRWGVAFRRSALYWVVTLLRLVYMIVAMATLSMPTGYAIVLILVLVTSLSAGQFFIILRENSAHEREEYNPLHSQSPILRRPRAKSKPEAIFIHPTESNLARADARALELGIAGATDRVARTASPPPRRQDSWVRGAGRVAARAMLGAPPAPEKDAERRQLWHPSSPESDGYDSP